MAKYNLWAKDYHSEADVYAEEEIEQEVVGITLYVIRSTFYVVRFWVDSFRLIGLLVQHSLRSQFTIFSKDTIFIPRLRNT